MSAPTQLDESLRTRVRVALFRTLQAVPGVVGVTVVGSFNDSDALSVVSDIDTVVVVRQLSQPLFEECVARVAALQPEVLGFPGYRLRVNATFGPLKFDEPGVMVVHLMLYDLAGHRKHVVESPFTCLGWEQSRHHRGPSLAQLHPVLRLQPRDFFEARRGLGDYLADLSAGIISYRQLEWQGDATLERKHRHPLDPRHQGEFAFHVLKHLVANYVKLVRADNQPLESEALLEAWRRYLPELADGVPLYLRLAEAKKGRGVFGGAEDVAAVVAFAERFQQRLQRLWEDAPEVVAVRHGPTALNDGSFLGARRDPGLAMPDLVLPLEGAWSQVVASPLRRAQETAARLAPGMPVASEPALAELDYGEAEGLRLADLESRHPELTAAWRRGEDPRFPGGECSADVEARVLPCVQRLASRGHRTLLVSHQAALRTLVGNLLGVPLAQQWQLQVPHLQPLRMRLFEGRLHPDFSRDQKAAFADSLATRP